MLLKTDKGSAPRELALLFASTREGLIKNARAVILTVFNAVQHLISYRWNPCVQENLQSFIAHDNGSPNKGCSQRTWWSVSGIQVDRVPIGFFAGDGSGKAFSAIHG